MDIARRHVALVTGCKEVPEEYNGVQRGNDDNNRRPGNRHHGMTFGPALVQRIVPSSSRYDPRAAALSMFVINLYAPCFLFIGQAFRYSPENALYIFNQQINFII